MDDQTQKIKVLMIDDDPMLLKLYEMTAREYDDIELVTATNTLEGNKKAREEMPDAILLDLILGKDPSELITDIDKNTGFNFLIMLKGDVEIKNIPVIVFSNLNTKQDQDRARELQAADYLVKADNSPNQVFEVIKGVVALDNSEKKIRGLQEKLA